MPNIKSAKKRVKVIQVKTLRNQILKSAVKTYIKKFETAVASGETELAKESYVLVVKKLDQAVSKGIYHKNTVARKKSQLAKLLNTISA